ncbi:chemotaxis protein CheW [Oscillatoria sp. FACHB-1406]|uniref:chemotaxis protein CheW n=1 Tax=Oscillatoria sp. FACHB-1406 TaxID=2692846 RepID=UPI0016833B43|nr:chemotaxis protein CheW [Oscillatoria sp. FACHB-1406]MBD2578348.1 chemotaxis protein CheW [Oscillatoria sp. FACHB-1406]
MSQMRESAREKILRLAKQGDPVTLAALLERKLRDREIAVRVERERDRLGIVLESHTLPERSELVEWIAKAMNRLEPEGIATVEIWAYRYTEPDADWVEVVNLHSVAVTQSLSAWLESNLVFPSSPENGGAIAPKIATEEFLRFHLSPQDAALLPIACIKEVLQVSASEVLPVPHTSDRILGAYNWRGEMLWMVDLKRLLGLESREFSDSDNRSGSSFRGGRSSAIALSVEGQVLGLLVEQIKDIEKHDLQQIEPARAGLFDRQLLPFTRGYLTESNAIVLDARAVLWGAKQLGNLG